MKDKSCQHDHLLEQILSNTSGSDCGLTKIEASELQDKIKALEKDNSTLLKTLQIQQGALVHLTNLENDITKIKEDLARVLENNEKLLSSNSKLEMELQNIRNHERTYHDSNNADYEKAVTKKKKKTKTLSKEVQTELKCSETLVTVDTTKPDEVSETESKPNDTQVLFLKKTGISQCTSLTKFGIRMQR